MSQKNKKLTADTVLEVFEQRDISEHPVLTSNKIASILSQDGIDVTTRTVKNRLYELERSGEVEVDDSIRTTLYWLPGDFDGSPKRANNE